MFLFLGNKYPNYSNLLGKMGTHQKNTEPSRLKKILMAAQPAIKGECSVNSISKKNHMEN
jgi:hypothetical protein